MEHQKNRDLDSTHDARTIHHFDQLIKDKMAEREVPPPENHWQRIEPGLPLNLLLKNQLNFLSKFAAVLLLGFICTLIYSERVMHRQDLTTYEIGPALHSKKSLQVPQAYSSPDTTTWRRPEKSNPSGQDGAIIAKVNTKALLDIILKDDESFSAKIDTEKIRQVLQPLRPLTYDQAQASLSGQGYPELKKENDLLIKIPLKIVEEHEVQEMLDQYEQFTAMKKGKANRPTNPPQ